MTGGSGRGEVVRRERNFFVFTRKLVTSSENKARVRRRSVICAQLRPIVHLC